MTTKVGQRIKLISHTDPHASYLKPGDTGTVSYIDDAGTVHIQWDNGSGLGLIPGVDVWEEID